MTSMYECITKTFIRPEYESITKTLYECITKTFCRPEYE